METTRAGSSNRIRSTCESGLAIIVRVDSFKRLERLGDVLHWLNGAQVQAQRFLVAWTRDHRLTARDRMTEDGWRGGGYQFEAHLLLVALNHVVTALDRVPLAVCSERLSSDTRDAVTVLRDVLEHWEQHRGSFSNAGHAKVRAAKRYEELFPSSSPWTFRFGAADGVTIHGALNINRALEDLARIEAAIGPMWVNAMREVGLLPYRGPIEEFSPSPEVRDTPEVVAVLAFRGRARAVRTIEHRDHAIVLVLADTVPESGVDGALFFVETRRSGDGWACGGGSNGGGGWISVGEGFGIAYVGGRTPLTRTEGTLIFRGEQVRSRADRCHPPVVGVTRV